jgi:hypothetical protein
MASAKFWAVTLGGTPREEHEAGNELRADVEATPANLSLLEASSHPGQSNVQPIPVFPSFQIGFLMAYEVHTIQRIIFNLTRLNC